MSFAGRLRTLAGPLLATREEGQTIQRNVSWLAADRVVRFAVGAVLNVWMIRYLGPPRFGLFSFAQSVVGILALLSQLGLETILVRDLVRHPERAREILGSTLALRVAGAVAVLGTSVAAMLVLRPDSATALRLAIVFASIYFFLAFDVIESWFQSRTQVAPYVVAKSVAFVLSSAAKTWALAARAPIEVIAATMALEYALASVAVVVVFRREAEAPRRWRPQRAVALGLLRDAWPMMLNNIAVMLAIRFDQVMLTMMRGERENGIYAVAPRLTEILYFIPVSVYNATAPALFRSHARSREEYERRLTRVLTALTWMAIAIALPVSILSPWIIRVVFPEYVGSAPVWSLHIWSAPASFMGVGISAWFIAEGRQAGLFVRSLIAVLANVLLNLWLIPAMGARGAALATLISQFAAYWLANAVFPESRRLFRIQCRSLIPVAPPAPEPGE